jgi:hypothetical protein
MAKKNTIFYLCLVTCISAKAQNEVVPFQDVFDVLSTPQIYASTWDKLLRQLQPWCVASIRSGLDLIEHGNIECRDVVNAESITVSSGSDRRVSMIAASFEGAAKCTYMKKKLTKNFGKPTTTKGECGLTWRVTTPKGKPQRYVNMESSPQDDKVYFSIGEEQGP